MKSFGVRTQKTFIPHPDFSRPGIEHELFAQPLPDLPPARYDPDVRTAVAIPVLTRDEERLRFLQYNYARLRRRLLPEDVATWAHRAVCAVPGAE